MSKLHNEQEARDKTLGSDGVQAEPLDEIHLDGPNRAMNSGVDLVGHKQAATTAAQTADSSVAKHPVPAAGANGSRFVCACLRLPVDRTPVWFLRQAGRYMPEYMAVRKHHSLLEICNTPEIAAEVTITAAERLGVDAAIIFADLLLPFTPMGVDFEFVADEGPRIHTPIRTVEQVRALRTDRTEDLAYVARAVEKVAAHFAQHRYADPGSSQANRLGIIGFIGAPFTLASYMIEGAASRNFVETKRLMYASVPAPQGQYMERRAIRASEGVREVTSSNLPRIVPANSNSQSAAWPILMDKLVTVLADYAAQQVAAGADVIQVFDSWVGTLSPSDYRQYALAPTTELIRRIRALGVPVIYFGVDTATLLPTMRETGADVLGIDWRIPLDQAWYSLGHGVGIQGNLDPIVLLAPDAILHARVAEILHAAADRPGHIFNLGHGIVPGTPVDAVLQVVQQIKNSVRIR
jgi:uroporphyrinogen decarboxylase